MSKLRVRTVDDNLGMLRTRFAVLLLVSAATASLLHGQTSADAASQKIADQLPKDVQQTLSVQSAWDKGFDRPAGSRLRFLKIDDGEVNGKHIVRYRILATGAKTGETYLLSGWNIGKRVSDTQVLTDTAFVNRRGLLMAHKPTPAEDNLESAPKDAELELTLTVARGEPYRVVLRTRDSSTMIGGTLVAYPISSQDKNCRLTAMIASKDANAVLIYADGFKPNSNLVYSSNSASESSDKTMHINELGRGEIIELPYVVGKDAGILKVSASSKECTTSIEVPWGKDSYKPL